ADPARVLQPPRLIEAEEPLELGDHGRADDRVGADHLLDHGPRDQPQHQEDEHGQPDERQRHRVEPDGYVASHTPSKPYRSVVGCWRKPFTLAWVKSIV